MPRARRERRSVGFVHCRRDGAPVPDGRRAGRAEGNVSLTTGRGPLSARPAGRFTAPMPAAIAYLEPYARRVRAVKNGVTVIDSERVLLIHRPGRPPSYAFPEQDVHGLPVQPEPDSPGYVAVEWTAVDSWFEEAEEVLGH